MCNYIRKRKLNEKFEHLHNYIRRRAFNDGYYHNCFANYALFYAQNELNNITDLDVYVEVFTAIANINEYCWKIMDWNRYSKFV